MKWIVALSLTLLIVSCAASPVVPIPPPRPFPDKEQYDSDGAPKDREKWKPIAETVRLIYPGRLLSKGVQGWVVLSHSIEPDGTTSDFEIIDSSPSGDGSFDAISIRSVSRVRYELVEGELPGPRVTGVIQVLKYEIDK
jgi:outer membrane biosynthesis protein TonB